ncbi:SNF2 helicase associated domain-containing protein [Paenibacillus sp. MMS20-IR301]|uniref:DEAD/DEAH box helicase n=1 Tax=Paenibacillus sp. MMS20-IR301 TaxID=2895946 RepID=UPI0028F00542|nr:SNF2 helicase associated domain-containing protein [Paenibacillus sp. MMS20-IR301]WNS43492.1 SNF2 helicase associated domain-containing protein [Paenibacillus sp. MMS20-IR301]
MGLHVPERVIKLLCGRAGWDQGLAYYQAQRVNLIYTEHGGDGEYSKYRAMVHGLESHEVALIIDNDGDVNGECSCPAYYHGGPFCKHIAAALVAVLYLGNHGEIEQLADAEGRQQQDFTGETGILSARSSGAAGDGRTEGSSDRQLVSSILGMFTGARQRPSGAGIYSDVRTPLQAEFICKPLSWGSSMLLGIELRVGQTRLYNVSGIRVFLDHVHRGEPYEFSRHFRYDPALHSFTKEDNDVVLKLIEVMLNEQMVRSSTPSAPRAGNAGNERLLPVPPFFWESLLPALTAAPAVRLQQGTVLHDQLILSDEALPLSFRFDQAQGEGYRLDVQGLGQLTILEDYGLVLSEGRLLKLPVQECGRLTGLRRMLSGSQQDGISIAPEQMEPFLEGVVPGLKKLGQVFIADSIADRIVQAQLHARLYLDRVRDRLLAGLEFQYGGIVINPLDEKAHARGSEVILMRDGEAERRILDLMAHESFARTESGYIMQDEEGEFDFLHHTIPLLEPLLQVYATTAVKERVLTGQVMPKVNLSWNEKTDWLDFKFAMDGIPEKEIVLVLKSLQEKRRYYRLPDGALLPLETAEFQEIIALMNELGVHAVDIHGSEFSLPLVRGLQLQGDAGKGDAIRLGRSFRRLLSNMSSPENLDFPVPESLVPVLRDYQQYGFQWMKTLAHYRFGGILADDMGLGKTLQSIAFLLSELADIRLSGIPALIVAPASLLYNWHNELKRFAPEIQAVIADGNANERSRILRNPAGNDVIITSYPLLRRDAEDYAKRSFHTLILDEAQMIKNAATQTAQAAKLLQARYRFALTGTPVENALEDLWSIFGVVFPGLFPGKKAFHDLQREAVARRARPFLLRRLKSDVLKELPDKIETLQASELLPEQKKLYVAYLARLRKEALKHLDNDSFGHGRIKVLAGLTRLRQLCCHPALFVDGYSGGSGKFEQLLEIIEECRSSGKRMLVFSQFTQMLGMIGRELALLGIPHFYLDGQTPAAQRVELCSRFNEGERDLFLISLKAGGTGLNLTGADTVILYDLWWNPAVEQQAADRAHRIGQKQVVQVIRLVAQGTVEDKMYELQQKKKNLIDEVVQPGQEALSSLSEQDIREILAI